MSSKQYATIRDVGFCGVIITFDKEGDFEIQFMAPKETLKHVKEPVSNEVLEALARLEQMDPDE